VKNWAAIILAIFVSAPVWAQDPERALRVDRAELIGVGKVQAGLGVEFLHRARYSLSGLEGDLLRLGTISFSVGVGDYAEFQISGVAKDYLSITKRSQPVIPAKISGDTTSDFGDLVLGTKLKLAPEKGVRPAISFKFAVQLPNASNEKGLGNDETEFYSGLLLSKHLGRAHITGNVGLAILGSPVQPSTQADLLTYGLGITVPIRSRLELVGEWCGRQGPERVGNENLSQVQAGARLRAGGLRWDLTGIAGLKHYNSRSGLALAVTYEFQAFHQKRNPVTVRTDKLPDKK
jgi:hypothetical protein